MLYTLLIFLIRLTLVSAKKNNKEKKKTRNTTFSLYQKLLFHVFLKNKSVILNSFGFLALKSFIVATIPM